GGGIAIGIFVHHPRNSAAVGYSKYTNGTVVTGRWGESVMYRVLTCLATEHDWRLVVLAGTICWLASAVAISLFHRARASRGRTRAIWICLDAGVGGCGIWATHFVALLVAVRRDNPVHTVAATGLLTVAIVSHHFTAMGAVTLIPDPTLGTDGLSISPTALSFLTAVAAFAILGLSLLASMIDRRAK